MEFLCKIGMSVLIAIGNLVSSPSYAVSVRPLCGERAAGNASYAVSESVTHFIIWHKDGSYTAIALDERPVLQFDEAEKIVAVTTSKQELFFSLETVRKYTLELGDDLSGIAPPLMGLGQFSHESDMLYFNGFKRGCPISIYSVNGVLIGLHKVGCDGTASISTASWEKGIYLIKTDSTTYKIIKK